MSAWIVLSVEHRFKYCHMVWCANAKRTSLSSTQSVREWAGIDLECDVEGSLTSKDRSRKLWVMVQQLLVGMVGKGERKV